MFPRLSIINMIIFMIGSVVMAYEELVTTAVLGKRTLQITHF